MTQLQSTAIPPKPRLKINEIFYSIQGESSWQGVPCIFIRLTGCNLRCNWCDTTYSFYEGYWSSIETIMEKVKEYPTDIVEITGGEPLLQPDVYTLMDTLISENYTVLLETSGSIDISKVDKRVIKIVDIKTPSSGEADKNLWHNIQILQKHDEVKFVIGSYVDFKWSLKVLEYYNLIDKHNVLFSPVWGKIEPKELAKWILESGIRVRLQLQLHKILWGEKRGV